MTLTEFLLAVNSAPRFLIVWSAAVSLGAGVLVWHFDGPALGLASGLGLGVLSAGMCLWAERQ